MQFLAFKNLFTRAATRAVSWFTTPFKFNPYFHKKKISKYQYIKSSYFSISLIIELLAGSKNLEDRIEEDTEFYRLQSISNCSKKLWLKIQIYSIYKTAFDFIRNTSQICVIKSTRLAQKFFEKNFTQPLVVRNRTFYYSMKCSITMQVNI